MLLERPKQPSVSNRFRQCIDMLELPSGSAESWDVANCRILPSVILFLLLATRQDSRYLLQAFLMPDPDVDRDDSTLESADQPRKAVLQGVLGSSLWCSDCWMFA